MTRYELRYGQVSRAGLAATVASRGVCRCEPEICYTRVGRQIRRWHDDGGQDAFAAGWAAPRPCEPRVASSYDDSHREGAARALASKIWIALPIRVAFRVQPRRNPSVFELAGTRCLKNSRRL